MESIDPSEPLFQIHVDDRCVAIVFDPRFEDMFWCSYRLEPVDEHGDSVIHDEKTWEKVAFSAKDKDGREPNPLTFSGGFSGFCSRETDRLSFRSLWPPQPPIASIGTRLIAAVASLIGYNREDRNSTER